MTALKIRVDTEMGYRGFAKPSWVQMIPYELYNVSGRYQGNLWSAYVDALYSWARADTSGPGGASGIHIVDVGRRLPRSDVNTAAYPSTTGLYVSADMVHPLDQGCAAFAQAVADALPLLMS